MTPAKRMLDLGLVLVLGAILVVPTLFVFVWLLLADGRPVFYVSERMRGPDRPFQLWKFRTMTLSTTDSGVSGGDKAARVTRVGRVLRKLRLDEVPQLWNILRGDMSFVGPRPPLRSYVERFPDLYARVLLSRPGLTGLATLRFRRHEERLLARCTSAAQTDAVYARRCVPRKARLDLIYQRQRNLCMDVAILWETIAQVVFRR